MVIFPPLYKDAKLMIRLNKFGFDYLSTKEYVDYYQDQLAYNYNPAIDPRAEVIGDDPSKEELR